jgi:hypothetical protein
LEKVNCAILAQLLNPILEDTMSKILRLLSLLCIACVCCGYTNPKEQAKVTPGNVIYTFAGGKMQCQSEVNPSGEIVVLLKSLDKNTTVQFSRLQKKNNDWLLVITMLVNEKTDICASWINKQDVTIQLDPLSVDTISLTGKQVYTKNGVTVLI